ncbi:MAG: 50S ribosome-binding GTPase [Spirochaetaceae bacterium]|nr:50S ribosome-binding GTPase [Spirochaetaceae bacterium]
MADLEAALQECRRAARDGSKIAQKSLRSTKEAFDQVTIELLQNAGKANFLEAVSEHFRQFGSDLDARQEESRKRLEEARRGMDDFSITLFGRTMAGKSTLMEILTNGNGASIGKGAQRTTRDVRSYRWRGLKVTDVPGTSAFEGAEDERWAFDAAKDSDLVLFLITDDAPQAAEAACFARVRALGKPLIGICNVKSALEDDNDLLLFLHAPERRFDKNRLKALERQFHELAAKHSAGAAVFFVFTHLLARFMARRPEHRHHSRDLQRASRFSMVERRIVDMIVRRGTFLRIKRFIDLAGNPSGQMSNELLDFSTRNADDGRIVLGRKREIDTWLSTSRNDWSDRIEAFVGTISDALRAEIPGFVEDHYQNPAVSLAWKSVLATHNINAPKKRFQRELHDECEAKLAEHRLQLKNERRLFDDFAHDLRISLNPISDSKRAWNWFTTTLSGLLFLGSFLPGFAVLGLVAAGVGGLGSWLGRFFKDREYKATRQRDRLSKNLHEDVEDLCRKLRSDLYGWLNKSVVEPVEAHVRSWQKAADSKFNIANAQRKLAWTLNRERKTLHRQLLCNALDHIEDGRQYINLIRDVARVPGTAMMLVVDPGTHFPDSIRRKLQDILTEKIWFVVNTNQKSIVHQALRLKCDFREINIEGRVGVVHVPVADLDATDRARVDLTQQLTELHVKKSARVKGRL